MYSEIKDQDGNVVCIRHNEKGWLIPCDPANNDYAEYLAWLAAGNISV